MQDPDNNVQKNYECHTHKPKEQQKWYNVVLELQRYFPEYQRTWGSKPSQRTAFYDMQDKHLITSKDYNTFVDVTVTARLGFVDYEGNALYPELPIDCFSDEKIHSVTAGFYGNNPPREPTEPDEIEDWEEYIDRHIESLKSAVSYYDGQAEPGSPGRIGGYWYNQPEYVEVWEEKLILSRIL